jgi:hypothetical protein
MVSLFNRVLKENAPLFPSQCQLLIERWRLARYQESLNGVHWSGNPITFRSPNRRDLKE